MLLRAEDNNRNATLIKACLLLTAVAVNAIEFLIPRIPLFPWLKPGLANAITLLWIIRFGIADAVLFSILRVWIVSFYFGFSYLSLMLGISGALLSSIAMGILWNLLGQRKILGTVGIAVIGALFHNLGQLSSVYLLMANNMHLFYQLPVMAAGSVLFGGIVGIITPALMRASSELIPTDGFSFKIREIEDSGNSHVFMGVALLLFCMLLGFVKNIHSLLITASIITIAVQIIQGPSIYSLFYPVIRFWILFLFVGALQSFFTYGTKLPLFPALTIEGLEYTAVQWLRLWSWLECSFIFSRLHLHASVLKVLNKAFPRRQETLYAALIAVESFPAVTDHVRLNAGKMIRLLFSRPSKLLTQLLADIQSIVAAAE